jgi:adenosylhomocysteinase
MSNIHHPELAPEGAKKIAWVRDFMPVLRSLEEKYRETKPLAGLRVAVCVHLEAKTAYLCHVLRSAGAEVYATGSNPITTKDEICASLVADGFEVNSWFGATDEEYHENIRKTLACRPHIMVDDGSEFVAMLDEHPEYGANLIGGCEETTTGILRLRARAAAGTLRCPMMAVNDADCKHLFDNHHGTGQSTWDAIMFTTNVMVSGKTVVVAGYGNCGSGIALRAKGLGANVIVTEVNPFRALEAAMDGFRVMHMDDAAAQGDIFVTATGCKDVITSRHFEKMRHDAIVANSGHFDVEFNLNDLAALSVESFERKPFITGYRLPDGRIINAMAEGRLVNISAGNGHPADIMDLSFAIQFMGALYLAEHGRELAPGLYDVPAEIDREIAFVKAAAMGLGVDVLTDEQEAYLNAQ